jgi:hypothetical protein
MNRIDAYLFFETDCREAMTFYQQCLGGDLSLMALGESGMAGQVPPDKADLIMHSSLTNGGVVFLFSTIKNEKIYNQLIFNFLQKMCFKIGCPRVSCVTFIDVCQAEKEQKWRDKCSGYRQELWTVSDGSNYWQ